MKINFRIQFEKQLLILTTTTENKTKRARSQLPPGSTRYGGSTLCSGFLHSFLSHSVTEKYRNSQQALRRPGQLSCLRPFGLSQPMMKTKQEKQHMVQCNTVINLKVMNVWVKILASVKGNVEHLAIAG